MQPCDNLQQYESLVSGRRKEKPPLRFPPVAQGVSSTPRGAHHAGEASAKSHNPPIRTVIDYMKGECLTKFLVDARLSNKLSHRIVYVRGLVLKSFEI